MVIIYSKPNCPQCNATKRDLTNKGIDYKEIDLSKDQNALDKMLEMGYKSAPIVEADGSYWTGFRPDLADKLILRNAS